MPPAVHKGEPHGLWLAKNCVAFLRNSHIRLWRQFLEGEAESLGAALEIADHPAAVPFFILGGAGIMIRHAIAQAVVKQDRDLACCGRDRLRLSRARRQPPVKRAECGVAAAYCGRGQTQECCRTAR